MGADAVLRYNAVQAGVSVLGVCVQGFEVLRAGQPQPV